MPLDKQCELINNDDDPDHPYKEEICHFNYWNGQARRHNTYITPGIIATWPMLMAQQGISDADMKLLIEAARVFLEEYG